MIKYLDGEFMNINKENFKNFNYYEIKEIECPVLRNELLTLYLKELNDIYRKYPDYFDLNNSIVQAYFHYADLDEICISKEIFPGDRVSYILSTYRSIACGSVFCVASGCPIKPGEGFIKYNVVIENLSRGGIYKTDDFIVSSEIFFSFPTTIGEFERFNNSLTCAFESGNYFFDNLYTNNKGVIKLKKFSKEVIKKRKI